MSSPLRNFKKADDYASYPVKNIKLTGAQTRYVSEWGKTFVDAVDVVIAGFKSWVTNLSTIGLAEDGGSLVLLLLAIN